MGEIGGKKRENNSGDFSKRVGLFTAKVLAINPTEEEYKEKLGMELKEDSRATEYLGESEDGNVKLRLDVWLQHVNTENKYKVSFFLENKEKENKDMTKKQYINSVGVCSWADDPNNLPDWFKERPYRVAMVGEEELYSFLQSWLNQLDYRSAETVLEIDWKKLMKGNVRELKDQIDGEWSGNFVPLATIVIKEKDGEVKEYQSIYNKKFLPEYSLKQFRLIDYDSKETLDKIEAKKMKDRKPHERFALEVHSEYGCKDFFILKDIKDYDPADTIAATNDVIKDDDASY